MGGVGVKIHLPTKTVYASMPSGRPAWLPPNIGGNIFNAPVAVQRSVGLYDYDPFVVPAGQTVIDGTQSFSGPVDGVVTEHWETESQAEADSRWQASGEYALRVQVAGVVQAVQQQLAAIPVAPAEKAQVVADVDAWVAGAETAEEKIERLTVAMRLQTWYAALAELVGEPTGLISGVRQINLGRGTERMS
jgi:hypothetical protein